MSRQIRISIEDDEVFERLKRRKDALDLSWEDVLRRGLRDSSEPPRGPARPDGNEERRDHSRERGRGGPGHRPGPEHRPGSGSESTVAHQSPLDPRFGERLAENIRSSLESSLGPNVEAAFGASSEGGAFAGMGTLDDEIDRLEDAEDAVLVLGDGAAERVPLRVELRMGVDGLDVDVVAVRKGKDTEGMNRFGDGARAAVARRLARGDTARLELADGDEVYDVRPDLSWARGPDGVPVVTDAAIRRVVFDEADD